VPRKTKKKAPHEKKESVCQRSRKTEGGPRRWWKTEKTAAGPCRTEKKKGVGDSLRRGRKKKEHEKWVCKKPHTFNPADYGGGGGGGGSWE